MAEQNHPASLVILWKIDFSLRGYRFDAGAWSPMRGIGYFVFLGWYP
jgi:hypothetical protein